MKADGYLATVVTGQVTYENGVATDAGRSSPLRGALRASVGSQARLGSNL